MTKIQRNNIRMMATGFSIPSFVCYVWLQNIATVNAFEHGELCASIFFSFHVYLFTTQIQNNANTSIFAEMVESYAFCNMSKMTTAAFRFHFLFVLVPEVIKILSHKNAPLTNDGDCKIDVFPDDVKACDKRNRIHCTYWVYNICFCFSFSFSPHFRLLCVRVPMCALALISNGTDNSLVAAKSKVSEFKYDGHKKLFSQTATYAKTNRRTCPAKSQFIR